MEHREIKEKLSAYMDNAVTETDKQEIEMHLGTCTACRDALSELRKTVSRIKDAGEVEPPAWLTQRIMEGVRSAAVPGKGVLERLFFPLYLKLPLEAAALFAIGLTTYLMYTHLSPQLFPETGTKNAPYMMGAEVAPSAHENKAIENKTAGKAAGGMQASMRAGLQQNKMPEKTEKQKCPEALPPGHARRNVQGSAAIHPLYTVPAPPPLAAQRNKAALPGSGAVLAEQAMPSQKVYGEAAPQRLTAPTFWQVSLTVANRRQNPVKTVENILTRLGGTAVTTETLRDIHNIHILIYDIDSGKADKLLHALKGIGNVRANPLPHNAGGTIRVRIELFAQPGRT